MVLKNSSRRYSRVQGFFRPGAGCFLTKGKIGKIIPELLAKGQIRPCTWVMHNIKRSVWLFVSITAPAGCNPPSYPVRPSPPPSRARRASWSPRQQPEAALLGPPTLHPRRRRGRAHRQAPPATLLDTGRPRAAPRRQPCEERRRRVGFHRRNSRV